ncbi:hypothetical protein J007_02000 [Cryptococcus neoformans]|nr:hypothetical protein J007_02000 [Cryptococcus neoformans var. grubii]OXC62526.1 hypothetical protein C358_02068 [Cryptococcus neoformans var. grubii MW-RSA852]
MVLNGVLEGIETVSSHPAFERETRDKGKVSNPLLDAIMRTCRSATPLVAVKPDAPKITLVLPHAPESFRPDLFPLRILKWRMLGRRLQPETGLKQLRLATSDSKATAWRPPTLATTQTSSERTEKKLMNTTQIAKENKPSVDKKQLRPFCLKCGDEY